jgi:hypothetical protein
MFFRPQADRKIYLVMGPHRFEITFETEEELDELFREAESGICPFRLEKLFGAIVHKVTN